MPQSRLILETNGAQVGLEAPIAQKQGFNGRLRA
jgi:hypothetical protein